MAEFDLPEAARRMNGEVWENPGEAFVGTCDAGGGCDDDTFAIVLTDDGWLSLCREHTLFEVARDVERLVTGEGDGGHERGNARPEVME